MVALYLHHDVKAVDLDDPLGADRDWRETVWVEPPQVVARVGRGLLCSAQDVVVNCVVQVPQSELPGRNLGIAFGTLSNNQEVVTVVAFQVFDSLAVVGVLGIEPYLKALFGHFRRPLAEALSKYDLS